MFTCCDVGVLESTFFDELEEYSVVHSSEGTFKVRVGCVYVSFRNLCFLVHHDVRREAVIYVSIRAESVCGVGEDAFGFRRLGSNANEDGCP